MALPPPGAPHGGAAASVARRVLRLAQGAGVKNSALCAAGGDYYTPTDSQQGYSYVVPEALLTEPTVDRFVPFKE